MLTTKTTQAEKAAALRLVAERIASEKTAAGKPAAPAPDAYEKILQELQVHQIELEMQNGELRQSQLELEAVRARYFNLYNLAPISYITVSENGAILESNLTASLLLGAPRGVLSRLPISRFIHKEDQDIYYLHRKTLFELGDPVSFELRMVRQDGSVFWASLEACLEQGGSMSAEPFSVAERSCHVMISDISVRKSAQELAESLLKEKELLLKEVHHRTNNTMNTVYSLLSLHAAQLTEPSAIAALEDAAGRVHSMMMLYDSMFQAEAFGEVSILQYLPALIDQTIRIFPNGDSVTADTDIEDFTLDIKKLQPLGLIVNELLTNAMKHAFKGKPRGWIKVSAKRSGDRISFSMSDDGNGMPGRADGGSSRGMGMSLIKALSKQLDGELRVESTGGTTVSLEFSV